MSTDNRRVRAYSIGQPTVDVYPSPIISKRAPTTSDRAEIGTIWLDTVLNDIHIMLKIVAGSATWLSVAGGSSTFSTITATTSVTTPLISNANTVFSLETGTGEINIGADAVEKPINIGNATGATNIGVLAGTGGYSLTVADGPISLASGTGQIDISTDATATTVNIATGAGAKTTTIGSTNTTSTTVVNSGTGGLELNSGGQLFMQPATVSAAAAAATLNAMLGVVTLTGLTTAAAASQELTITNSDCAAATYGVLCSVNTMGTNDAQMTITRVKPAAGSFVVTVVNNGAAALNGDIILSFHLLVS